MTEDQVGALIAVNGLLSQLAGAVLLVGLFTALLRSHPRPQPYFRQWTLGWAALVVALGGVAIQYAFPEALAAEPRLADAANLVYQCGKLVYAAYLLAGTLNFARGSRSRLFMRWAVPAAFTYALASTLAAGANLNVVMVFQMPLLVAPFFACAWFLLRLSRSRATLGSRTTGVVFVLVGVLWILYVVGFAVEGFQPWSTRHGPFHFLLRYNSFFDLTLQMLLGYGMVVLLLEDVSRESEDARYQLALAHDRLKQLSLYDALTGALNRRAYDEGAGLEPLGGRFGTALMVDMDNLKTVNDTAGHSAGDELLRRLVETLRRCVRPLDRIYRWGGDEFLLLFPAALPQDVIPRVREALEAVPELEVSLGAARFSGSEDLRVAIERADRAMYEEKAQNRARRVAVAGRPARATG